jgi:hypothetical protein
MPKRDRINEVFDVLELVILRVILLALMILGGYMLVVSHFSPR